MLRTYLAQKGSDPRYYRPVRALFGGRFSGRHANRVLVLFETRRISYTQIYPLIFHARAFARAHDAEFRLVSTDEVLAQGFKRRHLEATHVVVQTWLTDPEGRLEAVLKRLETLPNLQRRVYFDSFANSDIRFARHLGAMDLYYKKSLLRDPADMTRPMQGHTTLMEYYGGLYGITHAETDWQVPEGFLPRLRLAPNFLTGPALVPGFLGAPPPPQEGRDIDLHARLGGTGEDSWYGAMRRDSEARVAAMRDLACATGTGIPRSEFMAEMARAKLCFSPFGYGELCWRDIEAFEAGAVLIKPDMSHLATEPDLYRDDETYVATAWDFSDLEEKTRALLADPARRTRIARTAWEACRDYLNSDGPVQSYGDIFSAA